MELKQEKYNVGVIIGRFQVPKLHESHKSLIRYVIDKTSKVIILLGVAPTLGTRNNPLDFEMRKQMILSDFPNVNVLLINDSVSDEVWSKNVDSIIQSITTPNQKVVLYGGRESFIGHYSGKYPTLELDAEQSAPGTEIRKEASVKCINSPDFRSGVIWAQYNQYPKVFTTVDVAILKFDVVSESFDLLLARKPNEKLFRFVGGFADPNSDSFEDDAKREVQEETGLEVSNLKYLKSFKVEDWRYRKEVDKVKTLFFVCDYVFGKPTAQDDIAECKWFDFDTLNEVDFVFEHRKLYLELVKYVNERMDERNN